MTKQVHTPQLDALVAKIIAIFNQKGGCGKTMTSMQLGGSLALHGLRVLIADMDPQNTATLSSLSAPSDTPFPAHVLSLAVLGDQFLNKLLQYVDKYDVIIIDCPPALESTVPWVSLLAADLALIPFIPTMENVWASKQAEELVQKAREKRGSNSTTGELQAAYVRNMLRRGNVFEVCEKSLRDQAKIAVLESSLAMRNAFPEAVVLGCPVKALGRSPASQEVDALAVEVAEMLGLTLEKKAKK